MGLAGRWRTRRERDLRSPQVASWLAGQDADSFRPDQIDLGRASSFIVIIILITVLYPSSKTPHWASWHMLTDGGRPSLLALLGLIVSGTACFVSMICTMYYVPGES